MTICHGVERHCHQGLVLSQDKGSEFRGQGSYKGPKVRCNLGVILAEGCGVSNDI